MEIRKITTILEETYMDTSMLKQPTKKAAAVAIIKNPFAGQYEEDLTPLMDIGEELGRLLTIKARDALNLKEDSMVHNFGKGIVVGEDGELEHAAAIIHCGLGITLRKEIGGGRAVIPSAKKVGGVGTSIDVPLHYKDAMRVRSHYDAMEVRIPDSPKRHEILIAVVLSDSGRPFPRIGGHALEDVIGEDGLV